MRPGDRSGREGFPRSRGRRGAAGFTHVEVLIAILIIGMTTPIFVGGLVGSLSGARRSQERGAAAGWVQGAIDALRAQCLSGVSPSVRKVTATTLRAGEPPLPDGFAAAVVSIEPARQGPEGATLLRATVSLYRKDWDGSEPTEAPVLRAATYLGDLRVAGVCP